MAVHKPIGQMIQRAKDGPESTPVHATPEYDRVRMAVARLYVKGLTRAQIAKKCHKWLVPDSVRDRPMDQQSKAVKNKLRRWEQSDVFRDLVWNMATTGLDLRSGTIIEGIAKQAERGRVDAARLAFELTGRHTPKGDSTPTQVAIVVNGVPRPKVVEASADEIVEGLADEL